MKSLLFSFIIFGLVGNTFAKDCLGFPRVSGFTSEIRNSCLGLVADTGLVSWSAPRQLLFTSKSTLVVSDFSAWKTPDLGKVWQIDLESKAVEVIYSRGRLTHGLGLDDKSRLLIGDTNKIVRIEEGRPKTVVDGLPTEGRHPLTHFIVMPNNDLVVNIGAPSDHCKAEMGRGWKCFTRDREAGVFRYTYDTLSDTYHHLPIQLGKGLRNSMALLYNPILDVIYQAENNVDVRGTPEEFNQLPSQTHEPTDFGWPYCLGMGRQASYMKASLQKFCSSIATDPLFLIPAHSSPLDMDYYQSDLFPEISNSIVMGWHGHTRTDEQAIVAYPVDDQLAPSTDDPYNTKYKVVLSGVNANTGAKLRPVGLTVDDSGNIWFVDDKTLKLYVFASSKEQEKPEVPTINWKLKNKTLVDNLSVDALQSFEQVYGDFHAVQSCDECHGVNLFPTHSKDALIELLNKEWLTFGGDSNQMPLFARMKGPSSPQTMPPQPDIPFAIEHPKLFKKMQHWVQSHLK